jgi:predicted PurR-regulated permease PerM
LGKNAVSVTGALFGGIFSTLTIIIVAFYLLLYHDELKHFIAHLFHKNIHQRVYETLTLIDDKLGAWLRGQLVLCVFIGLLTFIALTILGVPYALPLAVMAGFLEAIPTLGPTLSAVPATVVAISISPSLALVVIVVYMVIQLLENNILVPKIMQAAVGLNPVVVILGVTIGANLMGISGALLSIPFISFIIVIISSLRRNFDEK